MALWEDALILRELCVEVHKGEAATNTQIVQQQMNQTLSEKAKMAIVTTWRFRYTVLDALCTLHNFFIGLKFIQNKKSVLQKEIIPANT